MAIRELLQSIGVLGTEPDQETRMSTLVVQRGHVARTSGATGASGEQAMARRVAAAIVELIKDVDDWDVRVIDADEPNSRYRGDAFVALHGDSSSSASAGGASVGHRNAQGRELGAAWKAAYEQAGWPFSFRNDNYTTALARYYGTGQAVSAQNPRAVIVEHGFMSNPTERAWIDSPEGTRAAAAAVVAAVTGLDVRSLLEGGVTIPETPVPTPPPSSGGSTSVITVGDKGADVREWQQALLGWDSKALPRFGADGDFGAETAAATGRFMVEAKLVSQAPQRPIVGPRTWEAMRNRQPAPSPTPAPAPSRDRFQMGPYRGRLLRQPPIMRGNDVRDAQRALNITGAGIDADGAYGPLTERAVRLFQRAAGARVDGIVGPVTWRLLRRRAA